MVCGHAPGLGNGPLPDEKQAHRLNQGCDDPGDRVGQEQHQKGAVQWEYGIDPHHPQHAHAKDADNHGRQRRAKPPHGAYQHIHYAAGKIGHAHHQHALQTVLDDLWVDGVDAQQRGAQQIGPHAQHQAHACHQQQVVPHHLGDAVEFLSAVVLPCKAEGGLGEGVHGRPDKALDIAAGSAARHGDGAKGVHRGLDEHVGDGEGGALNARGHADLHHLQQLVLVDGELFQLYPVDCVALHQAQQHQRGRDALGNHRGDGHAFHAHVEDDDEDQIQDDVDHPGNEQEIQGPLGVPHRPQDSRAKVVEHHHRHADKIDAHVQHRLADHIFGGAHHLQQGPGKGNAQKDQHHAANQADQHRRVHRLVQVLALARPIVPGHQHVDADGKADKQVDNQLDESAGRTHRRQGLGAHKLPHHNDVRRVEQQLQNARKGQRDGKPDGFPHQGAVGHVNLKGTPVRAGAKG